MTTHRTPRLVRALGVAAILTLAGASHALAVDSKDNAALGFWRAFSLITPEQAESVASVDRESIGSPDFTIDNQAVINILRDETMVRHLLVSAAKPDCDFAIEHERGPDALLPHLGPMRRAATILVLRARLDLDEGNSAHAAAALEAVVRSAEHLVDDDTLISSLVSAAILATAQPVIEYGLTQGAFDAHQRATLRAALDRFAQRDPFKIIASMRQENRVMSEWAIHALAKPGAVNTLATITGADEAAAQEMAERFEGEALHTEVSLYSLFMKQAIDALEARDQDTLTKLEDAVAEGAFGDLTKLLAPSFRNVLRNMDRSEALLASLRESLAR